MAIERQSSVIECIPLIFLPLRLIMTLLTGLKQKIKITSQRSRAFNKFIVDYLLSLLSQSVEDAKEGQGLDRARTGPLLLIQRVQLFFLYSSLLASSPGRSGSFFAPPPERSLELAYRLFIYREMGDNFLCNGKEHFSSRKSKKNSV